MLYMAKQKMIEKKISRVCWNSHGWRKPSGRQGKSKNKELYENKFGFGHEEWLLDTTKLIDEWHYAFLQPIGLHRGKYVDQTFNISLYSINDDNKSRWWVGRIKELKVISRSKSKEIHSIYKKKGWLKEMEQQLCFVGANAKEFMATSPENFVVVKYKPESLDILDTPIEFSVNDPAIATNRYSLLNEKQPPGLFSSTGKFSFVPGHKQKKVMAKSTYEAHSVEIDLAHNNMQACIYHQLIKKYGKDNVRTEQPSGNGSNIDIVVRDYDGKFIFFEIKTSFSVRLCIREAVGQLLEYACLRTGINAKKLIVVSPNKINSETRAYIRNIRNLFKIPLYYQRYVPEKEALEKTEY